MSAVLRRGGVADLDDVMEVMSRAFEPRFGEAWTYAQCLSFFGLAGTVLILSRDGAQPSGFALGRSVAGDAELLLLAVTPAFRRQSLGSRLIDAIAREAAATGAQALHLEVRESNPAMALYERCGFVPIGRRRNYYRLSDGSQADAITLSKTLTAEAT